MLVCLLYSREISPIKINRKALVMEGLAPVVIVYNPHDAIIRNTLILFECGLRPRNENIHDMIP